MSNKKEENKNEDKQSQHNEDADTPKNSSNKNKNLEDKPSNDNKSKTKEPDTQYVPKEQFISVSNNLSKKDKQLSKIEKELEQMKNREIVKDKLLESDLPDIVRNKIKNNINNITPESFDRVKNEYLEIYEYGKNSYKEDQNKRVNKTLKSANLDVKDKLKLAKTKEELEEIFNKIKSQHKFIKVD